MVDHEERQDDQGNSEKSLETVHHEDEGTVSHGGEDLEESHQERRHCDHEHDRHWDVEHPTLTTRTLEEHSQSRENERREELVGGAKEWPDAHVTRLAKRKTTQERDNRRDDRVAKEGCDRTLLLTFRRRAEFL